MTRLADDLADPDLFVDATAAREVRMLTTLLAGCDPCAFVRQGAEPDAYYALALITLQHLHRGSDEVEILQQFPGEAEAAAVLQFVRVAMHWWTIANGFGSPALQRAALAFAGPPQMGCPLVV